MIIVVTAILLCATSCKTVQISDLKPKGQIQNLLPALEPKVDKESLESAYSSVISSTRTAGAGSSLLEPTTISIGIGGFLSGSVVKKDKRIQEAITLFEREVKDNLTNPIGEKQGSIVCKVVSADTRSSKWALMIPSVLTLGILNVFGMPFHYFKTEIELEVEIKDLENNTVVRYESYGKGEVPIAFYYGYYGTLSGNNDTKSNQAARKSNINAFKTAMKEIKNQINRDYSKIISKLGG